MLTIKVRVLASRAVMGANRRFASCCGNSVFDDFQSGIGLCRDTGFPCSTGGAPFRIALTKTPVRCCSKSGSLFGGVIAHAPRNVGIERLPRQTQNVALRLRVQMLPAFKAPLPHAPQSAYMSAQTKTKCLLLSNPFGELALLYPFTHINDSTRITCWLCPKACPISGNIVSQVGLILEAFSYENMEPISVQYAGVLFTRRAQHVAT